MKNWSAERPNWRLSLRAFSTVAALALLAAACSATSESDATSPLEDDATPQGEGTTATPLVVTTDLGPGDVIALTFLLGHPDIDVVAVAVDGGVLIDCEIGIDHVLRLVAAAGTSTVVSCGEVPAAPAGTAAPAALREAAAELYGLELPAAAAVPDDRPPANVIADAVASAPGEVRVLALGPLTHVAAALELGGDVAGGIGHVYAVGGPIGPTGGELNFSLDTSAAIAVLESGVPLTLLSADAGSTRIVPDAFEAALDTAVSPAGALVTRAAAGLTAAPAPSLWGEPLAAAIVNDESVATFEMARVRIEQSGALIEVAEGHRIRLFREPQAGVLAATLRARFGATEATAPQGQPVVSASGRLVWRFALDRGAQPGNKSRSVLDDGVLYLVGFDNRLYAVDSGSGAIVWDRDLEERGPGLVEVAISPDAIFIRDVTLGPDDDDLASSIAAFDRITGDELWRVRLDQGTEGLARNPAYGEGLVVYGAAEVGMIGADPATGETLWTFPVAVIDAAGAATVADGVVYFGARDGIVYALDAASGTEIWRVPTRPSTNGVTSTPAVVDGVVYFGSDSGQVMAVRATSGDVIWETDMSPVQGIPSSPAVGDGKVFFGILGASDAPAGLFALDAATGTEVWSDVRPSGGVISSPVFADGVVYVLTLETNALVAFDATTGVELWSFDLGGPGSDSPVVAGGVVYFQANGEVFAVTAPE
ncbi:MAG: PQQ-binding-like beta-propeller repeat protein [Acidobacteria bacterium]|nr:PQQ-binding-like beta-propeller repeat protein [Acidobacteriota bacterium]